MLGKLARLTTMAISVFLLPTAAEANETDFPRITINGFGTLGVVRSDENQADFVSNLFVADGAGFTRELSAQVDSRLGLQFTANLTPKLTGVLQFLTEQRYDDNYTPTVERANIQYDVTPDLSLRAGRLAQSLFMTTEYRKVGYAIPWIRTPEEVYRMIPVTNFDGVDFSFRSRFNGFTNTLRGTYGHGTAKVQDGSEVTARSITSITNTLEFGVTTLSAGYGQYRLTIEGINSFFDTFRQFGPEGSAIANRYDVDDSRFEVITLGARYDPGNWFVTGELAHSNSDTFIGNTRGWYVTGGYRYGAVTPYLTLARLWVSSNTSDPGLSLQGLPPPIAGFGGGLNAGLNGVLGSAAQQKSLTLGARWDLARNKAMKVQYERLWLDEGSPGVLVNIQPGFKPGGQVSLFSVSLDFIF